MSKSFWKVEWPLSREQEPFLLRSFQGLVLTSQAYTRLVSRYILSSGAHHTPLPAPERQGGAFRMDLAQTVCVSALPGIFSMPAALSATECPYTTYNVPINHRG
ncbi:MAG: hypothetical protein ACO4AC_10615 [Pseudohongiellaceae bacterium]